MRTQEPVLISRDSHNPARWYRALRKIALSLVAACVASCAAVAIVRADPIPGINRLLPPLVKSGTTGSIPPASNTQNGYLTSADHAAFSAGGGGTVTGFIAPLRLVGSSGYIPVATDTTNGYLSAADHAIFSAYASSTNGSTIAASFDGTANPCASTVIPADNTIPQSTEGCPVLTKSYTPLSATSVVLVSALVQVENDQVFAERGTCALFDGVSADARASSLLSSPAGYNGSIPILFLTTGYAGARTWSVRCGGATFTSELRFNQVTYGNTSDSTLVITEIGSGSGGGAVPDPYTGNGWTPASGTATITGAVAVTGTAHIGGYKAATVIPFTSVSQSWGTPVVVTGEGLDADASFSVPGAVATDACVLANAAVTNEFSYECRIFGANVGIVTSHCISASGCVAVSQQSTFTGFVLH